MARGFESKSVESQQADREAQASAGRADKPTANDAARLARRRTLELARTRALSDLASACQPNHRAMLEAALESLEAQIREL